MKENNKCSSTIKVLLVEDSLVTQIATKYLLKNLNYSVEVVGDGKSALKQDLNKFDMILLDMHLPDIDGISLFKKIREKEKQQTPIKNIPIVAYTSDEKIKDECFAVGFSGFITKSGNFEDFKRLIQRFALNNNKPKPE
jgi:CheY-like chemotaxis protein